MMKRLLQNIALLLFSIFFATIAAELVMSKKIDTFKPLTEQGYVDVRELARRAALARGSNFDERSLHQIVTASRKSNERSFPAVSPAYFLMDDGSISRVKLDGRPVIPLGIAASADNFYCNESGEFVRFTTDRFGFRNLDGAWSKAADIVAIGDSYTMGSCVGDEESIVGNLRRSATVLNLGMGANGPLIELASLREFAGAVKPKVVLWNFFPNDIEDLARESKNPVLIQYLKPEFSQQLQRRNTELQPVVDDVIDKYWLRVKASGEASDVTIAEPFYVFPSLRRIYKFYINQRVILKNTPEFNIDLYVKVLQVAKADVEGIGAKLFFAYIPDCTDFSYGQNIWKNRLLEEVAALGVTVIDTEASVKSSIAGGQDAYFYCPGSHFTPAGAKAAAAEISKKIAAMTGVGNP